LVIAGAALAAIIVYPADCKGTGGDRISGSMRDNTIFARKGNDRIAGREVDDG
jgi:hypothetical protein